MGISKKAITEANNEYGYYSKLLKKPFDSLEELKDAEAAELKLKREKEDAAKAKKNDAVVVENAYKALNAAKKAFKDDMNNALIKHATALKVIQEQFNTDKAAITEKLANAEKAYKDALSEFTAKHPEGFHITLKDGDYETVISRAAATNNEPADWIAELMSKLFNI